MEYEKEKGTSSSAEDDEVEGDIVIELCGGMNCLALGLKKRGQSNKILRYISIENNERARMVAQAANPKTDEFCGIDREWCNDVCNSMRCLTTHTCDLTLDSTHEVHRDSLRRLSSRY